LLSSWLTNASPKKPLAVHADVAASIAPDRTECTPPPSIERTDMTTFKNILVPTDFSEPAEEATLLAVSFAEKFDAKLTLLHVYELPPVYGYGEMLAWPAEDYEREAQKWLDGALSKLKERYPRVEAILDTGRASERILAVAKDRNVDLIVIGTHGRRGLSHVVFGSVAEKVVRSSPVPVLTVGPRGNGVAK
jgi:nucleotide-binding universal stress UspA family protein